MKSIPALGFSLLPCKISKICSWLLEAKSQLWSSALTKRKQQSQSSGGFTLLNTKNCQRCLLTWAGNYKNSHISIPFKFSLCGLIKMLLGTRLASKYVQRLRGGWASVNSIHLFRDLTARYFKDQEASHLFCVFISKFLSNIDKFHRMHRTEDSLIASALPSPFIHLHKAQELNIESEQVSHIFYHSVFNWTSDKWKSSNANSLWHLFTCKWLYMLLQSPLIFSLFLHLM